MIRVIAREASLVPVAMIAATLCIVGVLGSGSLIRLPMLERGVPLTWLIASASILCSCYMLRGRWGIGLSRLWRSVPYRALLLVVAMVMVVTAYSSSFLSSVPQHEPVLVAALLALGICSVMVLGPLYWLPVTVAALGFEFFNNLSWGRLAVWVHMHIDSVSAVAFVALALASGFFVGFGPQPVDVDDHV